MGSGRPIYIVDGYNVVFSPYFSPSKGGKGEDVEALRTELTGYLDNYMSKRGVEITVVWDGEGLDVCGNNTVSGRVKVVFTKRPENADTRIIRMVEKSKSRGRITVVSNDRRHITGIVKNLGAKTMSVERFLALIGYTGGKNRGHLEKRDEGLDDPAIEKKILENIPVDEWLEIFKKRDGKGIKNEN